MLLVDKGSGSKGSRGQGFFLLSTRTLGLGFLEVTTQ